MPWGRSCPFRADSELSADDILCKLREALPQDIGALELEEAPPRFHARLSARSKTYVYHVWNSNAPCVFQRRYTYIFRRPLDADAMRQAAELLCGTHDFASFCSAKHMKHSTERTITDINIARQGDEYVFTYTGDGFLYNMVRIITGTLLSIGAGERKAEEINAVLAARDRSAAGPTAPAKGTVSGEGGLLTGAKLIYNSFKRGCAETFCSGAALFLVFAFFVNQAAQWAFAHCAAFIIVFLSYSAAGPAAVAGYYRAVDIGGFVGREIDDGGVELAVHACTAHGNAGVYPGAHGLHSRGIVGL
jgi:tRNA pseudouridine38-40 synthase